MEREVGYARGSIPAYRCTVGAHRGSSVKYLENSLQALKAADEDPRYAFIEFDVQYTKDSQIIVFHDQSLFRLFGSMNTVGNSTYAQLLDKSNGAISLYSDVMDVLSHKRLNIEIKSQGDAAEDTLLADAIMSDIRARGREKDVMMSSISVDVIRYIKKKYPSMPTGQIFWLTASTYVHLDALTEGLYGKFNKSEADYLMLYAANVRNIESLLKHKPVAKTVMFWNFDDCMYMIHHSSSDRLWNTSSLGHFWQNLRYRIGFNRFDPKPLGHREIRTIKTDPYGMPSGL
jgi:glycerophosphoryl diester phosphodiesterase